MTNVGFDVSLTSQFMQQESNNSNNKYSAVSFYYISFICFNANVCSNGRL